jgi:hypothetical protein
VSEPSWSEPSRVCGGEYTSADVWTALDEPVVDAALTTAPTVPATETVADAPAVRHPESRLVEASPPDLQTVEQAVLDPAVLDSAVLDPAVLDPAVLDPAVAVTDAAAADRVEPTTALEPTAEAEPGEATAEPEMAPERQVAEEAAVAPAEVETAAVDVAVIEPPVEAAPVPAEENLFDEVAADVIDDDAPIMDDVGAFPEPGPLRDDEGVADAVPVNPFAEPPPAEDVPAEVSGEDPGEATDPFVPPVPDFDDSVTTVPEPFVTEPLRLWTDASGQRAIVGTLVMIHGDAVVIRKAGGATVTVSLEQLSDVDRRHALAAGPRLAVATAVQTASR